MRDARRRQAHHAPTAPIDSGRTIRASASGAAPGDAPMRSLPPASPLERGAWSRPGAWSSRTCRITAWCAAFPPNSSRRSRQILSTPCKRPWRRHFDESVWSNGMVDRGKPPRNAAGTSMTELRQEKTGMADGVASSARLEPLYAKAILIRAVEQRCSICSRRASCSGPSTRALARNGRALPSPSTCKRRISCSAITAVTAISWPEPTTSMG